MRMLRHTALLVGLIAALATNNAQAGISVVTQFFSGDTNQWSDNSGEFLFNGVGNPVNTTVDIGDVLIAAFQIQTAENLDVAVPDNLFGAGGVNEFTGIAIVQVATKVGGPGAWAFSFAPVSAANAAALAVAYPLIGGELATWSAGSMVAFFEDATLDFTRLGAAGTEDATAATAFGGTSVKLWEMGFTGAGGAPIVGEGWTATSTTDDIAVIGAVPPPANGGTFNLALNEIAGTNTTDVIFGPVPNVFGGTSDIAASGSLLGTGGVVTPYDIFDNVDFVVEPTIVPEVGTVSMWAGLAVFGAAFFRRARTKRS